MTNDELIKTAFSYLGKEKVSRIWAWDIFREDFAQCRASLNGQKPNCEQIDFLSRSTALFLSSWGMYRGSGDLLDGNYRQFDDIIPILLDEKWWEPNPALEKKKLLFELLKTKIKSDLACQKIISGVFGCMVPFDNINRKGISVWAKSDLNETGKRHFSLNDPFSENNDRLYSFHDFAQPLMERPEHYPLPGTPRYPKERLIDIYFFWIGSCVEDLQWLRKHPEIKAGPTKKKFEGLRGFYNNAGNRADLKETIRGLLPDEILKVIDESARQSKRSKVK